MRTWWERRLAANPVEGTAIAAGRHSHGCRAWLFVTMLVVSFVLPGYSVAGNVRLDVPLVRQAQGRLCGPAAVEMVYRYWGEHGFDQYDIARQIASEFSTEKRYSQSDFLPDGKPEDYPGTPVYVLRKFLESRAGSEKYSLKELPSSAAELERKFQSVFAWIKGQLDQGVPVVIHQFWSSSTSTGHYRVITGYDDKTKTVFLNDAKAGKIDQSYAEFKRKGAVPGKWLPYYSIAYNSSPVKPK